ncbi:MAG TPA: hypothetical protein VKJ65_06185 [Phycisphaerae bacterium]|nr:hypothetical protein [Phycisphaerae bacterium]
MPYAIVFIACCSLAVLWIFQPLDLESGLSVCIFPACMVYGVFARLLIEQFIYARNHLMPGFASVNLLIGIVTWIILIVLAPLALILIIHLHSVGLISLSLSICALMIWLILYPDRWSSWIVCVFAPVVLLCCEPVFGLLQKIASGHAETAAMVMIPAAVFAICLAVYTALNSESKDNQITLSRGWFRNPAFRPVFSRSSQPTAAVVYTHEALHLPESKASSLWRRARRWTTGPYPDYVLFLTYFLIICFYTVWILFLLKGWAAFRKNGLPGLGVKDAIWAYLFIAGAIMPIFIITRFAERASLIPADLMRPVARKDYFRELIAAGALYLFRAWLIPTILIGLTIVLLHPKITTQDLILGAFVLVLSFAIQVLFLGLCLFAFTFHYAAYLFWTFACGPLIVIFACSDLQDHAPSPLYMTALALIPLLLGPVFIYSAYRRMIEKEWG